MFPPTSAILSTAERSIAQTGEALLDHYLPRFDVIEHHSIYVDTSPEEAYQAVLRTPLASSAIVRVLLRLRALPSVLRGDDCRDPGEYTTLLDTIGNGFFFVDEHPGREIILGTIGQFWRLRGGTNGDATVEALDAPLPPGSAVALWNFRVARYAHGSVVHTETRVLCADDAARRSFKRYWLFIGPFSALIRRKMLEAVKYEAETREP